MNRHYDKIRDPVPYEELSKLCQEEKMANLMGVLPHLHEGRIQQARTEYYNLGGHEMFGTLFEKLRSGYNVQVVDNGSGGYIFKDPKGLTWIMTAQELVVRINEALASLKADAKHPSKRFKISEIKRKMREEQWAFHPAAVNCAFVAPKKDTNHVDSRGDTGFVGSPPPLSYPDPDTSERAHSLVDESVGSESFVNMKVVDIEIVDALLKGQDRQLIMQKYNVDGDYLLALYSEHLVAMENEDEALALDVRLAENNYHDVSKIIKESAEDVKDAVKQLKEEKKKIANDVEFLKGHLTGEEKKIELLYARAGEAEKRKVNFEKQFTNEMKRQEEVSSVIVEIQRERGVCYSDKIKAHHRKEAAAAVKAKHELQMQQLKKKKMSFVGSPKKADDALGAKDNQGFFKGMLGYFTGEAELEAEQKNEKPKATPLRSCVEKTPSGTRRTPRKPAQVERFTYD